MSTAPRPASRQVAASSVILLAENAVRMAVIALVSFWVARALGPEHFGVLTFASAVAAILLAVASLGLETPVTLRLARGEASGATVGTAIAIRFGGGLAAMALAAAVAFALRGDQPLAVAAVLIVAVSLVIDAPAAADYHFKARVEPAAPALARLLATLCAAGAKIGVLAAGLGVLALAWTVVLETAIAATGIGIAYLLAVRRGHAGALRVEPARVRPLLRETRPFFLGLLATLLLMKVDVVLLGYLAGDAETGLYALAQKMSEVVYIVPALLVDSAYPALARRLSDGRGGLEGNGQLLFDLAVGASYVAILVALLPSHALVVALFGEAFERSAELFRIHVWSCLPIALALARLRWMGMVGLARYAPATTLLGLGLNLGLNLLLIPALGATGAAVSTVASYLVSGYLSSYLFPALRPTARLQTLALWPWGRLLGVARGLRPVPVRP